MVNHKSRSDFVVVCHGSNDIIHHGRQKLQIVKEFQGKRASKKKKHSRRDWGANGSNARIPLLLLLSCCAPYYLSSSGQLNRSLSQWTWRSTCIFLNPLPKFCSTSKDIRAYSFRYIECFLVALRKHTESIKLIRGKWKHYVILIIKDFISFPLLLSLRFSSFFLGWYLYR